MGWALWGYGVCGVRQAECMAWFCNWWLPWVTGITMCKGVRSELTEGWMGGKLMCGCVRVLGLTAIICIILLQILQIFQIISQTLLTYQMYLQKHRSKSQTWDRQDRLIVYNLSYLKANSKIVGYFDDFNTSLQWENKKTNDQQTKLPGLVIVTQQLMRRRNKNKSKHKYEFASFKII